MKVEQTTNLKAMIKKTYTIFTMILMFLSVSFVHAGGGGGQPPLPLSASIGNSVNPVITASPGESIQIPIYVTNFSAIGSITFKIRYNPALMNFAGVSDGFSGSGFYANATDSTISIAYAINPSTNIFNGTNVLLLNLNFLYLGISSSQLSFLNTSEVTQGLTIVYPNYTNCTVNSKGDNTCKASIEPTTVNTGSEFTTKIKYQLCGTNVGALTQNIKYDPTKLTFIDIAPTGNLTGAIASASNGVVTISWANQYGVSINDPTNYINIRFQYIGNSSTTLEFTSGSLIATNDPLNIAVSYTNGVITPGTTAATAVLGGFSGISQGDDIQVPLTFGSLPSGDPNGVGALTLDLPYDNSKLTYIGVVSGTNVHSATISNTGTSIHIAWADYSAPDINGLFLKLKFKYLGLGDAYVNFGASCSFTTLSDAFIQVAYTNSNITSLSASANATIGSVYAEQGDEALVPISFSSLPSSVLSNMGAVTLVLNYDVSKLTFIDVQDNINYATVGSSAPNVITISWASLTPTDLNGLFLNLRFLKIAPISDPPAAIDFVSGCELTDINENIIPANWHNGDVHGSKTLNLTNVFLEGLYDGGGTMLQAQNDIGNQWASGIADHISVELHDMNTYSSIVYAANNVELSTTGLATVIVPGIYNDSYYITIKHRNSIETTTSSSISFAGATVDLSFGAPANIFGANLKQKDGSNYVIYGGDVNQDGIVDGSDMLFVKNDSKIASTGYLFDDCNGDGLIDGSDMMIVKNNAKFAIGAVTP